MTRLAGRTVAACLLAASAAAPALAQADTIAFTYGLAIGAGQVARSTLGTVPVSARTDFAIGWRVGYRFRPRMAVTVAAGGTVYAWQGEGRHRKRSVEGLFPSLQVWLRPRLWVSAGPGVQLDAPVFYDVRGGNASERAFHYGLGALGSIGYALTRTKLGALEVQARVQHGYAELPQGRQHATTFAVLFGLGR